MPKIASTGLGITDVIGDKREEILRIATSHKAFNVRIFGSVARGEARPDSDVDFLVDFHEGASMWDVVGLWRNLTTLLGRKVNVVAEENDDSRFMRNARRDAVIL